MVNWSFLVSGNSRSLSRTQALKLTTPILVNQCPGTVPKKPAYKQGRQATEEGLRQSDAAVWPSVKPKKIQAEYTGHATQEKNMACTPAYGQLGGVRPMSKGASGRN